nr:hypothetical protein [uncultured Caproiciproducens sp.]
MTQFVTLILMAIIVEGLVTYAKTFFVGGKFQWQQLVGIALGVIAALAYNVDIFALLGITSGVPYVGAILTGILISRGSNYIFDLVKTLQNVGNGNTSAIAQALEPLIGSVVNTAPTDTAKQAAAVAVKSNTASNPPSDGNEATAAASTPAAAATPAATETPAAAATPAATETPVVAETPVAAATPTASETLTAAANTLTAAAAALTNVASTMSGVANSPITSDPAAATAVQK